MPSWSSHRSRREWELTALFTANKPLSQWLQASIDISVPWAYPTSQRRYVIDDMLRVLLDPPTDRACSRN